MQKSITLNRVVFHSCRKILSSWVKTTVRNNSADSLKIDASKPTCYVFRHRSLSDLLILENECIKAGLPRPHSVISHNNEGEYAFFYLGQQEGFIFQRERPGVSRTLEKLLERVEKNDIDDVQIIPVSVFWGRTPDKEQSALKLLFDWNFSLGGRFRKFLATLLHGRNTLVHFSPALSLRKLTDEGYDHQRTLRKIGRVLRVHFRQLSTSIIGPDLSHRRTLVNGLINSPHLQRAIAEEAKSKNITREEAEYAAKTYADEIASDFSFSAIRFLDIVLTWFWNKLYNGVSIHNIEPVKELAKTHTIIYVPCHRSHIDYLLLSYVLYYQGLTPPHIAAGINLNMPFVGKILRKSGAFFMRRTFKGNPLYSSVFHEYMYTLASRGFPMEYFIEGGRSRTGRTLSPKTGMLSISLRSYLRDNRRPVSFVPVYIGYEKLLEVGTYLGELRGKTKKKESPLDIFRTLAALNDNFGKAWVNFGNPIHLDKFLDQAVPHWRQANPDDLKPAWLKGATDELARKIVSRINSAATINPVNLVAMALLSTPRHALGEQELLLQLDTYTSLLRRMPYSNKTVITDLKPAAMIAYVEKLRLITRQSDSLGDIFRMNDKTAVQMTYYRNNVLHIFAIPSLISCLFVNNNRMSRKEVLRICSILYPYLSSELFIEWRPRAFLKVVSQSLNAMVDSGLIVRDGTARYVKPDTASTASIQLSVFSRAIIQTLERFYMTISILISHGNGTIEQGALENRARDLAQRLSIIHGLNAPEFFDKSLFKGFIEALRKEKMIEIAQNNAITFDHQVIQAAEEAFKVLGSEIRHSIEQPTMSGAISAEQAPH
ncbi:glycerol-3-phosphate 1-O-acyltransferase PlsB [Candidatus Sororendozoicomonas aggregata]|uniref:glycerol-3-phosphate 1-O-acyltransferase PlsB n=1 Tax=Candidatus Sororendozoicomonas aggregata TaxID=3073239 RepID=UPI002ED3861A